MCGDMFIAVLDGAPMFHLCLTQTIKTGNQLQCHDYGRGCWKGGSFGLISEEVATELLLSGTKTSALQHQPGLCVPLSEA